MPQSRECYRSSQPLAQEYGTQLGSGEDFVTEQMVNVGTSDSEML